MEEWDLSDDEEYIDLDWPKSKMEWNIQLQLSEGFQDRYSDAE